MDDLISEFITETSESLSVLDLELVKLEQNPEDGAILGNIFRIMHTIKGTCGFLGLPRLESVAHASENVLGKIRDGKLKASPGAVTLILESLDSIKALLEYLSQNGQESEGDDKVLIAKLNHFADTGELQGAAATPAPAAAPAAPAAVANGHAAPAASGFSHFKGEDEDWMIEAMAKMQQEEAAKAAATPAAPEPAAPVEAPAVALAVSNAEPEYVPAAQKSTDTRSGEAKAADAKASAEANQSIRVNLDVLENLMQMVSELVLTRNQLLQIARTREDKEFLTPLQQLSHITSELQEGVMKTRMQPIGNAWSKFPRLIRDLSLELNKKIELKMIGAETELDRQLLEMIKDPLTHMVRNSCDHGLEKPADRKIAGKPETGTVVLHAYHEGGHILIEIKDDGRGVNIARVKEKIISNGLATQAELDSMNDQQIMQYIFRAGFSTAEKVTSVSGRGVGMDVVKTNIEKIGGTVELTSAPNKGSVFTIKIPLTLAIVSVLIVEASAQKFAIPQLNVVEIVRIAKNSQYEVESINRALVMRLRDKLLPLSILSEVLGLGENRELLTEKEVFVAVCSVGDYEFGLVVDRVFDTEEIVVKPVAELMKSIPIYSGNTILGDGSVIMILDPNGLARSVGDIDISQSSTADSQAQVSQEKIISFLLFSTGEGAPKAVPLELVSRLEEIDASTIERAGDYPVVQYRDELMRLVTLDSSQKIHDSGPIEVIVFSYDKKIIGLVVEEVLDIVHEEFNIKIANKSKHCLGSMVISGKSTDVVDVASLLSDMIDSIVTEQNSAPLAKAGRPANLLLVEDSPFFRNLTVPFLSSAGHRVVAVDSGKEALRMLNQKPGEFDLIVTDLEMPEMNGFEFTAACRVVPQMKSMPILAYTSSMGEDVVRKGEMVGINECILKTDRPGLLQAVTRYLTGNGSQMEAA